jgi:hypothetical protein
VPQRAQNSAPLLSASRAAIATSVRARPERLSAALAKATSRCGAAAAAPAVPARESGAGGLLSSTAPSVRAHSVRRGGGSLRRRTAESGFVGGTV